MLVRHILPTVNNGQFGELLPLFTDEARPLFYHMTVEQAVTYRTDILEADSSLLMRIFLGELSNVGGERPAKLHGSYTTC